MIGGIVLVPVILNLGGSQVGIVFAPFCIQELELYNTLIQALLAYNAYNDNVDTYASSSPKIVQVYSSISSVLETYIKGTVVEQSACS